MSYFRLMLYLPLDMPLVLLYYFVVHEESGALNGLVCDLVQLPLKILLVGRMYNIAITTSVN